MKPIQETAAFTFDLNATVTHKSDHDLLSALEDYAKVVGYRYFQTREFDKWAAPMPFMHRDRAIWVVEERAFDHRD